MAINFTTIEGTPTRLQFRYVNHRGDEHVYLVEPKSLGFGPCKCFSDEPDRPAWHIVANVLDRDGARRAQPCERSFALIKMQDIEEITT